MKLSGDGGRLFTSLGLQEKAWATWHEPDRYRDLLEKNVGDRICVQGAGLSLSGAGFANGAEIIGMKRFNRILELDRQARTIHVEAGVTLGKLFSVLAGYGLFLAVQPGHPDITIGGCIAGNVHGKSPFRDGIFSGLVRELTFFHPAHGILTVSSEHHPDLFDLTCGGFGLTGIILSAKLSLEPFPASGYEISRLPVAGLPEAALALKENAGNFELLYSWLDMARHDKRMGRGFVVAGRAQSEAGDTPPHAFPYPELHTEEVWPIPVFYRHSLPLINAAYMYTNSSGQGKRVGVIDALFPFARRIQYFKAYGRRGFVEHQVLIPEAAFPSYASGLKKILRRYDLACGLSILKLFSGKPRLLWFSAEGVSMAIHLPGGQKANECLGEIDALDIDHGAIANIIKDARLSGKIVRQQYPEYDMFRQRLHEFDPQRKFTSALTERLGL